MVIMKIMKETVENVIINVKIVTNMLTNANNVQMIENKIVNALV